MVFAHVSFEYKPAVRDLLDYLFRDIQIGTQTTVLSFVGKKACPSLPILYPEERMLHHGLREVYFAVSDLCPNGFVWFSWVAHCSGQGFDCIILQCEGFDPSQLSGSSISSHDRVQFDVGLPCGLLFTRFGGVDGRSNRISGADVD